MGDSGACSVCGRQNPADAKFCANCGEPLKMRCRNCGHDNPPSTRFCAECGQGLRATALGPEYSSPDRYTPRSLADKILAARPQLEGERKQVTALFADVVGFTSMSERLDPEDAHAVMRRGFDIMLAAVHRYEGTVTQFLGDGMFALFGAPIAHEDHAFRAVRAGLALQADLADFQRELEQEWSLDFRVRVGVNSGLVVVGNVGNDLSMEYLAIGDTVNLASRVQNLAPPGSVVMTENTNRLTRGMFVTRDLGEQAVRGKEQPVRVHEALRAVRWRSRVDVYAESGLSPLVGREHEFSVLAERAELALSGRGQVVFLRGEAGIGKSRLLYELRRKLGDRPHGWLVGRCVSYGKEVAYLPLIDLAQDVFSIEEGDSHEHGRRKLADGLAEIRLDPAVLPYLEHLLGIDGESDGVRDMDPQLRKARTFEALRDALLATATEQPLVVVIEDLHWIDRVSTEFLSFLIEAVAGRPILLLLTHRPDWVQPFGTWPHFAEVALTPLSEEDTARVAEAAVGASQLPRELETLIHDKTEGNPFFVEEVVKSLAELGVLRPSGEDGRYELARAIEDVVVPDTVQGVIMARLDRLPEDARKALQTAAVIGREFTIRLLERTANVSESSDAYLKDLKAVELIHERSLYPELAFMFRHALTHDVAYSSLLIQRRKGLHRLVAQAIEEIYADRLPENYEALAYHYEHAEEWEPALEYLVKSGEKALSGYAPQEALGFLDRALAVVERSRRDFDPVRLADLHAARAQALALLNRWPESARSFDAVAEQARRAGDGGRLGAALVGASSSLFLGHAFEGAIEYAERARQVADETESPEVLAGSLVTIEAVKAVTGDLDSARDGLRRAIAAADEAGTPLLQGMAHVWAGFIEHWQGAEQSALSSWRIGRELGERHQLPTVQLWARWNLALALIGRGAYDEALRTLEEHLELTKRLGDRMFRCRTLNTFGWLHMDLCNWEAALDYNRRGSEESRALGDPEIIRNAELNLGDSLLAVGDAGEARRWLEGVERESAQVGAWGEEWMKWRYVQHLHVSLGELWLELGDPALARTYGEKCLSAAVGTRSRRNVAKAGRLLAKVALAEDDLDAAAARLDTALAAAREVGNPAQLRETLGVLGRLRTARGDRDGAAAAYDEALAIVETVAAGLSDPRPATVLRESREASRLREARAALAAT